MSKSVTYVVNVPNAATGTTDLNILHGIQVRNVHAIKTGAAGGAGDTVQLQTQAGTPVSNAISINVADGTIVNATTLDDGQMNITAAEGIRAAMVNGGAANTACALVITGFPTITP